MSYITADRRRGPTACLLWPQRGCFSGRVPTTGVTFQTKCNNAATSKKIAFCQKQPRCGKCPSGTPDTQPLSPRRSVAPRTVRTTTFEQPLSLLYMSLFGQTLFYNSAFNQSVTLSCCFGLLPSLTGLLLLMRWQTADLFSWKKNLKKVKAERQPTKKIRTIWHSRGHYVA